MALTAEQLKGLDALHGLEKGEVKEKLSMLEAKMEALLELVKNGSLPGQQKQEQPADAVSASTSSAPVSTEQKTKPAAFNVHMEPRTRAPPAEKVTPPVPAPPARTNEAPPPPGDPPMPPPPVESGAKELREAIARSTASVPATASPAQVRSAPPPGPLHIEVELKRENVNETWGFLWDRASFQNKQRIIDDIVSDSPAGRCNGEPRLQKGDELVALNGTESWDACSQLSKMTVVKLKFRRPASSAQGNTEMPSAAAPRQIAPVPPPEQEPDPELAGRTPDRGEQNFLPNAVPQGEQQRSEEQAASPDPETRERKIEKQMTLLRQLSDKKEASTGPASGVTSLMTQVEDLTTLANLLAQGEANEALTLVKPLLRKQVRTGPNGEPEFEPVDETEAARFLLEVMEVMESSNKQGSATLVNGASKMPAP